MSATTAIDTTRPGVPFARLVKVELRKMFDTRSGFWLLMSIAITALLASLGVILWAPESALTYETFGTAIGVPIGILLPIIAILSITSEWSQRSGLVTFTLSPHRSTVVGAKLVASLIAGVVGTLVAMGIGAITNVLGTAVRGVDAVWGLSLRDLVLLIVSFLLGQLIGFMLGTLIRNSAGAIVAYFVYSFVLPGIFGALYELTSWFKSIQPWIDYASAQIVLFEPDGATGEQWAQLGVTSLVWVVVPTAIGVWSILRSEVK